MLAPRNVLCETERVRRDAYDRDAATVLAAFRRLAGLRNVTVEDRSAVATALSLYESGLDFAHALHLASSGVAESFRTFDARLRRRAARLGAHPPVAAV